MGTKKLSLKLQFFLGVGLIMLIITIPASLLFQKAITDLFQSVSTRYANEILILVKNNIRSIMLSGHGKDIFNQIKEINNSLPSVKIDIFKDAPPRMTSENEGSAFQTSKYIKVMAGKECVKCHTSGGQIATLKITYTDPAFRVFPNHSKYFLLGFATISTGLTFIVIFILFSYFLDSPLRDILNVFNELKRKKLGVRVDERSARSNELYIIMREINRTLETLENILHEREKEFSAHIQRADRLATVGELASAIAHEVKNPLAGISGALQVIREEISSKDHKMREIFDEIMNQISRVSKTINDLLSLAKDVRPEFEEVNVHEILDSLLLLIEHHARKQGVEIVKKYDPDVPPITGDAEKLQQTFLNILLNAIQAMPEGGVLTVETEALLLEKEKVKVKIKDTGCGIKEEFMERIFEPFFTTKAKGTGLGMFTAKRIVELHHGKIGVQSEAGKGTEVVVVLPVKHTSP